MIIRSPPHGNRRAVEVIAMLGDAVAATDALLDDARRAVAERVMVEGRAVSRLFDSEQRATHGLAWLATYVEAHSPARPVCGQRLADAGSFGEIEELLLRIGAGEYLAQMLGGIPMSQGEIVRLSDLGLSAAAVAARVNPADRTSHRHRQYGAAPGAPRWS